MCYPEALMLTWSSFNPSSPWEKLVWTLHRPLLEFVVLFQALDGIESELGRRSVALILEFQG